MLARALHQSVDYQEAWCRYEQQMMPHVLAQQKSGRSFARSFLPDSSFGLFMQRATMKVLLRPAFRGLLQRPFGAQSLLVELETSPARPGKKHAQVLHRE